MRWVRSWRADPRARRIADEHYNRQKPGTDQFVPPGRCVVLLAATGSALWVTSWPYPEYVKHAWPGAWVNSTHRRESGELASDLILDAVAATRFLLGNPPPLGMVTFVDPTKVAGFFRRGRRYETKRGNSRHDVTLDWGYSYWRAGFVHVGWTKGGLYAMQLSPERMPAPVPPVGELALFAAS